MLRTGIYLQDRYEILGLIGSGGMSDVYKARCHKLNRLVAIKVLKREFSDDPGFVSKFQMEAQAAARLSHPNIVNVYDVVDEGSIHSIVMELIEGITLKSYIAKKGMLEVKEAVGIAIQVAQGIAAAHEQKIIHRDIKPQNMLISKDGKVKVADFGIARAVTTQTMTSEAMGSVHYISPEQARGGYCDERSDVYSLGITMYEMVTGILPFQGDNTVAVALAQLQEPITRPSLYNPEIPVSLEGIILKCTEKKPEYRYSQITDVIGDLRRVLVHPAEDFVQPVPDVDMSAGTVVIKKDELKEIKRGTDSVRENPRERDHRRERENQPERAGERDWEWDEEEEWEDDGQRDSGYSDEGGRDTIHRFERLFTALGILIAIIIVAVLIVVFSRLGGLLKFNSPRTPSTSTVVETETQTSQETVNEMEILVPDVLDLPVDMAEAKLKESTLVMKVSGYEDSDTVDKGCVISQSVPEGTMAQKYSTVTVVVSRGTDLVRISELSLDGMTADAAKLLLEQNKLVVNLQPEYHDTVPEGSVIRFEPQQAREGEQVTLYISSGPLSAMKTMPEMREKAEGEAVAALEEAGLNPGEVSKEFSDTIPKGYVISQEIEPGTLLKEGTAIAYTVSQGPEVKEKRFVAAINETYNLGSQIGPGALSSDVTVAIRLKQEVNGTLVYRTLTEAVTVPGNMLLPVSFTNIEGAPGVDSGEVEVVNVGTGDVLVSYPIKFIETE
ncbi:MAG: Stk1 family PASTA domain-containing Ser/Thr kinase [Hungatella sp.]|jgi:serine/threonine protein kinase/beta-lactam-binding protein with PASTA domain|nr:Stk1 family PASTA domain-containing Ser/Thr kinase [Hungatella sp.]